MPRPSRPNPYGKLLRERRLAAGWSLRALASALRLSHAYLASIEVGQVGPLPARRDRGISARLGNVTKEELSAAREASRVVRIVVRGLPDRYRELARVFASRCARGDLDATSVARCLAILSA